MLSHGSDQAEGLRRVLARHAQAGVMQTLVVIGAPGSGKTSCAINIGAELNAQRLPLRCIDSEQAGGEADDAETLLVLSPGIDAITRAYALIKREALSCGRRRFAAVVNRVRDEKSARAAYENVASAARRFLQASISYAGYVREDAALWRGPRVLAAQVPEALAAADYARVARALANMRLGGSKLEGDVWTDPLSEPCQQRRCA